MDSSSASAALLAAVTHCLAEHDLEGVMAHGAPLDEYAPEAKDFAWLLAAGEPVTGAVVARVWAEWFGDGTPLEPTPAMEALAAELQALPGQPVG